MVKKLTVLMPVVISVLLVSACAVKYTPKMTQHIKGSVFKASETGYYTTELLMKPQQPVVGMNKAHLIIHNYESKDLPGLRIYVTPYLPGKGIKSDTRPTVKDAGRGLYIIENISFPEPGNWELRLRIYGDEMSDTVTLPLPEVK